MSPFWEAYLASSEHSGRPNGLLCDEHQSSGQTKGRSSFLLMRATKLKRALDFILG